MTAQTTSDKRIDRRVLRTRKAIMEAFDRLVATDDASKITVSAIAREADIDRKTFYLHYSSVDDLVNFKAEQSLERILRALKERAAGLEFQERVAIALAEANALLTEDLDVYEHIASRVSINQILSYFAHAAEPAIENAGYTMQLIDDPQRLMKMQFVIAGSLSLYSTWLRSDHSTPIQTVSDIIQESVR